MGKYDVTYKCGHTGTVTLFGKVDERLRRIEYIKGNKLCPLCETEELLKKGREAGQRSMDMGFVALNGTPKQVAWAETIRGK